MRYWETKKTTRTAANRTAKGPKRSIALGGSLRQYPFLRSFYQHQAVISEGIQKFIFFLVMATLLYAFVFGDAGAIRLLTLNHEKSTLEKELAMIEQEQTSLRVEIERLKKDPFMMEKLGRERYGYVYPGDRVYKIINPSTER